MSHPFLVGLVLVELVIALAIVFGVARAIWTDEHRHILIPEWMRKKPASDQPDAV